MLLAFSPKAFPAPWLSSSRKSGNFIVLGSKMSRCHLCLAVAWDSGLTLLLRKMTNTSSSIWRFIEFILRNLCRAPFLSNEWKWFIFICSVIVGWIWIIVWNRSSNSLNFSVLPSKVKGFVVTGRNVIECGLFWRFSKTSASRLLGSCGCSAVTGSVTGRVVSRVVSCADSCVWRSG